MSRPSLRAVAAGAVVVSLLLAGVLSFYAAASPDGLSKVAIDQQFATSETEHAVAGSPFAGYGTTFVTDERLSGGLAGVVGVLVTLVLAGALAYVVRRRPTTTTSAR